MSPHEKLYEEFLEDAYSEALGPNNRRVAVLGAFDTWSYMHKICTDLAFLGYTAITSRYIYKKSEKTSSGYYRTSRIISDKDMNTFLQEDVIGISYRAIIIYSVPAAHYNEAEWCDKESKKRDFKTFGICFVRDILKDNYCKSCVVNELLGYSYCQGEGNAWDCINKPDCPFKGQGIAKNQIEYFLNNRDDMILIGVEKIEKTRDIIDLFLKDEFVKPDNYPYVFEFRIDLSIEQYDKMIIQCNALLERMEEKFKTVYKYIDYYYKPEKQNIEEWIDQKTTLRMRESRIPIKKTVSVYSSELIQSDIGFYSLDPFGNLQWFSGEIERSKSLLKKYNMNFIFKIIKTGYKYAINVDGLDFDLYLEKIQVEKDNTRSLDYGYSCEIEFWSKNTEVNEELRTNINRVVESFGLQGLPIKIQPVQEFIHDWSKDQTFDLIKKE